ncbi:MAG: hypothetical protein OXH09_04130 [Gammaproteobacteria bacterium]|nr:hypothetical protein [Gammaproteobacteria bacterium]
MTTRIKIYGERNTGTNYVGALIALNLAVRQVPGVIPEGIRRIHQMLPGREWVRDLFFACTRWHNLGWKHGIATTPKRLAGDGQHRRRSLAFVTITKNPYAWLLSLHRRPYHPTHPGALDFEAFLVTPWRTVGRDNMRRVTLGSPVELWNAKNRSYLELAPAHTLNTTYETTIRDPQAFVDDLVDKFAVRRVTASFRNHEVSTKDRSKDFGFYRDYYLNERWKDELTDTAIAAINQRLDHDVACRFGYDIL